MKRKFFTSCVYDSWNGEKIFNNAKVLLDVEKSDKKLIPVLLQRKLSKKINEGTNGRFFPVTLINFWEIDLL